MAFRPYPIISCLTVGRQADAGYLDISVTGMVPANMVGNGTTANTTAEVATA